VDEAKEGRINSLFRYLGKLQSWTGCGRKPSNSSLKRYGLLVMWILTEHIQSDKPDY